MANLWRWINDRWFFLNTFFPVKLFLLHLRRSLLLLFFWFILFGFITGFLGFDYGIQYLFLTPEYQGEIGFLSYFIMGFTLGLFIMAFHINSYIYYSYRYPFLATLSRPLYKFSINNSAIPTLFLSVHVFYISSFLAAEGKEFWSIMLYITALMLGMFLALSFTFTYFIKTIKTLDIPDKGGKVAKGVKQLEYLINIGRSRKVPSNNPKPVNFYLKNYFSVRLTRGISHYQRNKLLETIEQHHLSAALYFLLLILVVVVLSLVDDYSFFRIPAGATVFLIFALYLMIIGAIYSRFKTWTATVALVLLISINYFSGLEFFKRYNFAFGMNYEVPPAEYSYQKLDSLTAESIVQQDKEQGLKRLQNWRNNFLPGEKPSLVILNVSGGGQRSSMWTMRVLQTIDSLTEGQLYPKIHLITGSSGGMFGAAYYRELKYLEGQGEAVYPNQKKYLRITSEDMLNPVIFTLAVNDLFFRFKQVKLGEHRYKADRGYTFDMRWVELTEGLLDEPLVYRKQQEYKAQVPTLILAPTIVGDGRKLLMSSQDLSFLTFNKPLAGVGKEKEFDGVEFRRIFEAQEADSLHFATALRLSASFPYITPMVNMPSEPGMELIDAGVRDNEGLELALRYVYHFQDWIRENTSGVKIIQIKANRPDTIPIIDNKSTWINNLLLPLSGVVKSFSNLQIYNKALLMELSPEFLEIDLDMYRFSLLAENEDVSLSWHLTEREKHEILKSIEKEHNAWALQRLLHDFKDEP